MKTQSTARSDLVRKPFKEKVQTFWKVIAILTTAFITSCGGGSSSTSNPPVDPPSEWDSMQWDQDNWE